MSVSESQNSKILRWLESGKRITSLDAHFRWGCARLGARIWELKKQRYRIKRDFVRTRNGKHVAEYRLGR